MYIKVLWCTMYHEVLYIVKKNLLATKLWFFMITLNISIDKYTHLYINNSLGVNYK